MRRSISPVYQKPPMCGQEGRVTECRGRQGGSRGPECSMFARVVAEVHLSAAKKVVVLTAHPFKRATQGQSCRERTHEGYACVERRKA
eukprot:146061-Chlamydomonas_euryale.AAC.1